LCNFVEQYKYKRGIEYQALYLNEKKRLSTMKEHIDFKLLEIYLCSCFGDGFLSLKALSDFTL